MSGGKFRIVNYYKSLEPAGWNDNAVIRIYNECVNMMNESKATDENQIAKSNWKKEPEMDPDKMQEIWMPMTKEKVKPKKAKKKVKKHVWVAGEKCMADYDGDGKYLKAEIKHRDDKNKMVKIKFDNVGKQMYDYHMEDVHPRHFWMNDSNGQTNEGIEWRLGDPCYALYYQDGDMYAAVIQEVSLDKSECVVYYEDYEEEGNHVVKVKHLYPTHLWPNEQQLEKMRSSIPNKIVFQPKEDLQSLATNPKTIRKRQRLVEEEAEMQKIEKNGGMFATDIPIRRIGSPDDKYRSSSHDRRGSFSEKRNLYDKRHFTPERRDSLSFNRRRSPSSEKRSRRRSPSSDSPYSDKHDRKKDFRSTVSRYDEKDVVYVSRTRGRSPELNSVKKEKQTRRSKSLSPDRVSRHRRNHTEAQMKEENIPSTKQEEFIRPDKIFGVELPTDFAPLPPFQELNIDCVEKMDKEALVNMLVSWYQAGFHTGFYRALFLEE